MDSSDSIRLSMMMEKKRRPSRDTSILHLVAAVLLVSLTIYLWLSVGCRWKGKGFLCQRFSSDDVLLLSSSSTTPPRLDRDDFNKLIDLHNFTFLMNNLIVCNDSDPLLTVIVHSHPNNIGKRSTIRSTWGSLISSRFKLVFLVGIPQSEKVQASLEEENRLNKDLIQGNFVDAYRNMTYKHVMGLKWANYFCPNSRYILKTDDDVFVNSPVMLDFISRNVMPFSLTNLLLCSLAFNVRVNRSFRSKWRVTYPEYSFPMYPTYCEGFAIVYSPDTVYTLYAEAQSEGYFWIDDVHVTGLLAAKAKIKHSSFGNFLLPWWELDKYLAEGTGIDAFLIGPRNLKNEQITRLWEKVAHPLKFANETAFKAKPSLGGDVD